ncbi:MAG: hypothetical protein ABIW79_07845 [Gemmatimonas sp.]
MMYAKVSVLTPTKVHIAMMQTPAQAQAQVQAREMARQAQTAADLAQQQADIAQNRAAQAQPSREQIRDQIREDIRSAVQGAEGAAQSGRPTSIQVPDGRGGTQRITIGPNGVSINGRSVNRGDAFTIDARNAIPNGVVDIVQAVGATLVLSIVGLPLARAFARWIDRRGTRPAIPTEVIARLSNIENAVETVAVEVERISEGQRFTTKLLNDRQ